MSAMLPPDALFLGFDSSTQSLKATAIDAGLRLHASATVHFHSELPHYGTRDGVHRDPHETWIDNLRDSLQLRTGWGKSRSNPLAKIAPGVESAYNRAPYPNLPSCIANLSPCSPFPDLKVVGFEVKGRITGPVLMWVEALDLVLTKLAKANFPFEKVYAVSGSGQQHGSVYWAKNASKLHLQKLDPSKELVMQLQEAFSITDSPVWMDSSTSSQCLSIEKSLGGPENLTALTGSRAFERFTGPQIRKIYEEQEDIYCATERISLVSSFMASLLVGNYAAIDHSDGAGMNLMDLHRRAWSPEALQATAPGLQEKLGPLAASHAVAGKLNSYFVERYKFSSNCLVIQWSGDNPCSLAGLALNRPGDIAISLGTSDTVFGVTKDPHPGLEGHVFPNPVDPDSYMAMLVYKNGSLTREDIRNRCANGSWEAFNDLLEKTSPLNEGRMGFYYKESEILPPLPVGYHRYILGQKDGNGYSSGDAQKVAEFDPKTEVRAIVEGQFLSMRAHAERIGMPCPPERVIATGGGSANQHLLNLMASIFGCNVYTAQRPDSASLGAALRAAHGWVCHEKQSFVPMASILDLTVKVNNAFECSLRAKTGAADLHHHYGRLASVRAEIEQQLLHDN